MSHQASLSDIRAVISSDLKSMMSRDFRASVDTRAALSESLLSVSMRQMHNCSRDPHHPAALAMSAVPEGTPGTPYRLAGLPLGAAPVGYIDPVIFQQMGSVYGSESPDVTRTLPQLNGYSPYDTDLNHYMNGYAGIDVRRKNATKESTNTLKAWLYEHRKNPYPTKGEKIMLAIITKMTLTQVATWFANARRRLKKDNKVTWITKDDAMDDDDDDDDVTDVDNSNRCHGSVGSDDDNLSDISVGDPSDIEVEKFNEHLPDRCSDPSIVAHPATRKDNISPPISATVSYHTSKPDIIQSSAATSQSSGTSVPSKISPIQAKPKIWSIADVISSTKTNKSNNNPEITSSRHDTSGTFSVSSPSVSLNGAPVRPGGMPQGVVVPGAEGPYSLAYYPYGLPHPATAAMMASQLTSHFRLPHPYVRSVHASSGHMPNNHEAISTSGHERCIISPLRFPVSHLSLSPVDASRNQHKPQVTMRCARNTNEDSPGSRDTQCQSPVLAAVALREI